MKNFPSALFAIFGRIRPIMITNFLWNWVQFEKDSTKKVTFFWCTQISHHWWPSTWPFWAKNAQKDANQVKDSAISKVLNLELKNFRPTWRIKRFSSKFWLQVLIFYITGWLFGGTPAFLIYLLSSCMLCNEKFLNKY